MNLTFALRPDESQYLRDIGQIHFPRRSLTELQKEDILKEKRAELKKIATRNYELRCLKQGLTIDGKPRKRPYQFLTGLTEEQKHQRRLSQQRESMRKARS